MSDAVAERKSSSLADEKGVNNHDHALPVADFEVRVRVSI
jgi:hypothetical protein